MKVYKTNLPIFTNLHASKNIFSWKEKHDIVNFISVQGPFTHLRSFEFRYLSDEKISKPFTELREAREEKR